jgi:hypothetical protein
MLASALSIALTTTAVAMFHEPLTQGLLRLEAGHALSTIPVCRLVRRALGNRTWFIVPGALLVISLSGSWP